MSNYFFVYDTMYGLGFISFHMDIQKDFFPHWIALKKILSLEIRKFEFSNFILFQDYFVYSRSLSRSFFLELTTVFNNC